MCEIELIKNVLEVKNFELAKLILRKQNIKDLIYGEKKYRSKSNLEFIGLFEDRENFNFLINLLIKKGFEKAIKKELADRIENIIGFSNDKTFVKLFHLIPSISWFSRNFYALNCAVTNNNLLATKLLIALAKEHNINIKEIITGTSFCYSLSNNFGKQKRGWQILKLMDEEVGGIGEALVKAMLESSYYYENDKDVFRAIRVFKVRCISFSRSAITNSLYSKKLFFSIYRRIKPEERSQVFELRERNSLLNVFTDSVKINPDVAKFLMKQNLKALQQTRII